jgi:Na+-transporting methylmalonyl-CoA/oxaloacetate decarboxylase gamma subunit
VDWNFALNVMGIVLILLGLVVYAIASKRVRTAEAWKDAAQAEQANRGAAEARNEELAIQVATYRKQIEQMTLALTEAQARPDMSAVITMLQRITDEGGERTAQAMARVGELFDAQRAALEAIERKLNGAT